MPLGQLVLSLDIVDERVVFWLGLSPNTSACPAAGQEEASHYGEQ
jgi:hypothetical protein